MILSIKFPILAFSLLLILTYVSRAHAAPYQFQLTGSYVQSESEFEGVFGPGETTDASANTIGFTYYLKPVDASTGPLAERAFLSRSAWLSGTYGLSEVDVAGADEVKSTTVGARFVTQTDLIVELDYIKIGNEDDDATYSVGVGRYLDGYTTAVLKYSRADDDFSILSVSYRKLLDSSNSSTNTALGGTLGYIDTEGDSGYQIGINGSYYLSQVFSAGGGVLLQKIGSTDSTTFILNSEYFLTESIYGGIIYTQTSLGDFADSTSFGLNVGVRF